MAGAPLDEVFAEWVGKTGSQTRRALEAVRGVLGEEPVIAAAEGLIGFRTVVLAITAERVVVCDERGELRADIPAADIRNVEARPSRLGSHLEIQTAHNGRVKLTNTRPRERLEELADLLGSLLTDAADAGDSAARLVVTYAEWVPDAGKHTRRALEHAATHLDDEEVVAAGRANGWEVALVTPTRLLCVDRDGTVTLDAGGDELRLLCERGSDIRAVLAAGKLRNFSNFAPVRRMDEFLAAAQTLITNPPASPAELLAAAAARCVSGGKLAHIDALAGLLEEDERTIGAVDAKEYIGDTQSGKSGVLVATNRQLAFLPRDGLHSYPRSTITRIAYDLGLVRGNLSIMADGVMVRSGRSSRRNGRASCTTRSTAPPRRPEQCSAVSVRREASLADQSHGRTRGIPMGRAGRSDTSKLDPEKGPTSSPTSVGCLLAVIRDGC